MTLDDRPYYNPSAVPFCLEQPLSVPDEPTFGQRKQTEANPLMRIAPGYPASQTFSILFEAAPNRTFEELENWKRGDDLRPLLYLLAGHCYKAGIPEEEAVRQVMMHYYREADEQLVRMTLHNLYRECKGFGTRSSMTRDQITAFRLEEFMNRRYEFRWNTVLGELEFRQRDSIHFHFRPADQRVRSSIGQNAPKEGISVWDRDVARYLNSDAIPLYNPIEEYLNSTGHWDGKDRIRALADLVPCNNPYWRELFYRWFLSMTAHWQNIDRQHGNNTSPLLVGAQGYRKSTFCRILLPPELRFGYTDSIDFKSKQDAERSLGRFFPDKHRRIRPNQRQSARFSKASAAETRGKPAQALRHRHPGNKTLRLLYSNQQPERPADRPQRQPPFHLHRSHRPHPYQCHHQLPATLRTSHGCHSQR